MGNTENLQGQEAIKKIKELAEKASICMFATNLGETPLAARPMSTNKVEEDGSIWFFSSKTSDTNQHIQKDQKVQLLYSNTNSSEYLSIFGHAEITTDKQKIEELWSPIIKNWFPEGKEDPNITLLKVIPESGHYWDTKNNKIVQMAKIALGAITGNPSDDGLEGRMSV